jgi:hypothetical protein
MYADRSTIHVRMVNVSVTFGLVAVRTPIETTMPQRRGVGEAITSSGTLGDPKSWKAKP